MSYVFIYMLLFFQKIKHEEISLMSTSSCYLQVVLTYITKVFQPLADKGYQKSVEPWLVYKMSQTRSV